MANQRIDDRTIHSDSYAPFGELPKLLDRPEPTPAEREAARKADKIGLAEYLRQTGSTADGLNYDIAAYKHPKPISQCQIKPGVWEPIYSRAAIRAWRERVVTDLRSFGFTVKA